MTRERALDRREKRAAARAKPRLMRQLWRRVECEFRTHVRRRMRDAMGWFSARDNILRVNFVRRAASYQVCFVASVLCDGRLK